VNAVRRPLHWIRRTVEVALAKAVVAYHKALEEIDNESIRGYQRFYYPTVMLAGLYLWLAADEPTQALADTLGSVAYTGWLLLHFICPPAALIGRRVYGRGEDSGIRGTLYLGARLQLIGDAGVWAAICIYVACLINTAYWGQAIYPSFYLLMGVPGGFRFTLRSWRRLRQLREVS
jgi:hypothetical protein